MDNLFFIASKIFWLIAQPGNLYYIITLAIIVALWRGQSKTLKVYLAAYMALASIVAFLPIGNILIYSLEKRYPVVSDLPEHVDGIIVLSGSLQPKESELAGQIQLNESAERVFYFLRLSRLYPEAQLIYSGGSGSITEQSFKAADAAGVMLAEQNIDLDRLILERDSRNTYESAVALDKLINPNAGETWLLITTAWHMPRSVGVFCQVGWSVFPYSVDFRTNREDLLKIDFDFSGHLASLETGVKEWIGLTAYWLSGKTPSILPTRC